MLLVGERRAGRAELKKIAQCIFHAGVLFVDLLQILDFDTSAVHSQKLSKCLCCLRLRVPGWAKEDRNLRERARHCRSEVMLIHPAYMFSLGVDNPVARITNEVAKILSGSHVLLSEALVSQNEA